MSEMSNPGPVIFSPEVLNAANDGRPIVALESTVYSHLGLPGPLSLIHISEPTRQEAISYAVFCLK